MTGRRGVCLSHHLCFAWPTHTRKGSRDVERLRLPRCITAKGRLRATLRRRPLVPDPITDTISSNIYLTTIAGHAPDSIAPGRSRLCTTAKRRRHQLVGITSHFRTVPPRRGSATRWPRTSRRDICLVCRSSTGPPGSRNLSRYCPSFWFARGTARLDTQACPARTVSPLQAWYPLAGLC